MANNTHDPGLGEDLDQYFAEIGGVSFLSRDQEAELARRLKAGGPDWIEARNQLLEANLRFVVAIAKRYRGRGVDLADMIQEGNLGMMTAARKFQPERGYAFRTYAGYWIKQHIMRQIENHSRTVRVASNTQRLGKAVEAARQNLRQALGHEPTDLQIAARMDLPLEKVWMIVESLRDPLSIDMPRMDESDPAILELADPLCEELVVTDMSLAEALEEVLKELDDERDREILRLRFGLRDRQTWTLDAVGQHCGVTRERVRQLQARALAKIKKSDRKQVLVEHLD